ncbi:hypothetical protein [Ferrovibrio terrae]|uniref:hypothetical protein n=1 Tax=Ferrovibrio terrae TaxID=2594003 RepID=UPI0031380B95
MSTVIGKGPCPNCGVEGQYKVNQKSHLYVYCRHPMDGGCGSGTTSRSEKGDELLARKITKWSSKEAKAKWLGSDQPDEAPEEEEIEEAEEEGDLVEEPVPVQPQEPAPRPTVKSKPPSQSKPVPQPPRKPASRPKTLPPRRGSVLDVL